MKFMGSQFAYLTSEREMRRNLRSLVRYFLFLTLVIGSYSVLFHVIKLNVEHEAHSWITGFYWTLVVMTTLGFGDITFSSDIGRAFSVLVLLSGVVLLLVMLPFLFIRLFYAPWLEARVRLRAPRELPNGTRDHVILTELDDVAAGLVGRLREAGTTYAIIEPDPARAAQLIGDDLSVVAGENDSGETYQRLRAGAARLVLANCADTTNTNITLTVREVAPGVPIVAIVEEEESVDILRLSGATHVLPLKLQLGESLANRVDAGGAEAHVIAALGDLQLAELPVRGTMLAGRAIRDTHLRERTGLNVVGIWERGRLRPAYPATVVPGDAVAVVVGTAAQVTALDALMPERQAPTAPVIVIGGGKVGQAAARALKRKGLPVHVLDRSEQVLAPLAPDVDRVFAGDAADRQLLERAGIGAAPSVLLTTNDDAMNIYLAVYCRRLNPDVRIVSRITHERNVEAIHRAGADFALSYSSLGVEAVLSILRGHELVVLGEGVELFVIPVPGSLANRPLRESAIGSKTGLSVVALRRDGELVTQLTAGTMLEPDAELLTLGSLEQRRTFAEAFEGNHARR